MDAKHLCVCDTLCCVLQAGQCFCIKVVHIPVNEATRKVNISAMRRAITSRTCMVSYDIHVFSSVMWHATLYCTIALKPVLPYTHVQDDHFLGQKTSTKVARNLQKIIN